jgi:hypothetical protein
LALGGMAVAEFQDRCLKPLGSKKFLWGACRRGAHILPSAGPDARLISPPQLVSSVAWLRLDYLKRMALQSPQFLFGFDNIGLGQCLW